MDSKVANSGVTDTCSNSSSISSITSLKAEAGEFQMKIPKNKVGWVIAASESIRATSRARIVIRASVQTLDIHGTEEQIKAAIQLVNDVVTSETQVLGCVLAARRFNGPGPYEMKIPNVPDTKSGWVIAAIESIQEISGARVVVRPELQPVADRTLDISGTVEQIKAAIQLINDIVTSKTEVEGSVLASGRFGGPFEMKIPINKVGWVVAAIESIRATSGAHVGLRPLIVDITGTEEQVKAAMQLVNEVVTSED